MSSEGSKPRTSLTGITVIYAAGNVASKLISFIVVFFTTYCLSKEELGMYDLILTTTALAVPLLNFQLCDAVLRWLARDSTGADTPRVLTNVSCIVGCALLLFTPIYAVAGLLLTIPYTLLSYLLLVTSAILPVLQIAARGNGRNALFAVSGVVYASVYTAATLILVVGCHLKVEGMLLVNIAANIVTAVFIAVQARYHRAIDRTRIDYGFCKELILFSIPLIPNALAWWAFSSANRYIVLYYLGLEQNGIWSISYKLPTILSVFTSIFFMAWQEKALREFESSDRDEYFSTVLKTFVGLSLGVILVLTAAAKPLLHIVVEKSFFVSWKYTVFLMLANFFQSLALFYGVGYYCAKDTKQVLYTTLIGSLIAVVCSALLIPTLGLYGAGMGATIGFLSMFLVRMRQTRLYFRVRLPVRLGAWLMGCIAVCSLLSYVDSVWAQIANNLVAVSVAAYANRKFIAQKAAQCRPYVAQRIFTC